MLVIEKKRELSDLPIETSDLIPELCPACHESLSLSESLTELSCINPFCIDKLTQRAVYACQVLNIKNFGASFFRKFFLITEERFISNLIALDEGLIADYLEFWEDGFDISYDSFNSNLVTLGIEMEKARKTLTVPTYVKALALPNIKSRADEMLQGFTSLEDFYEALLKCTTMSDFNSIFKLSEGSEQATILIANSLATYQDDILNYESRHDYYTPVVGDINLKIVCSKAVGGGFRTKSDFYKYLETHFADKATITVSESATKSCDVLIWAGADGSDDALTTKVTKICTFNANGSHIPIMTASEFIDLLDTCSDGHVLRDTLDGMELIDYR